MRSWLLGTLFAVLSCGSSGPCPGIASECPAHCFAVEGSRVNLGAACLDPVEVHACVTPEAAAEIAPAQTCLRRSSDDAVVLLKGAYALPASEWAACSNQQKYEAATATAECP